MVNHTTKSDGLLSGKIVAEGRPASLPVQRGGCAVRHSGPRDRGSDAVGMFRVLWRCPHGLPASLHRNAARQDCSLRSRARFSFRYAAGIGTAPDSRPSDRLRFDRKGVNRSCLTMIISSSQEKQRRRAWDGDGSRHGVPKWFCQYSQAGRR